MALKMDNVIFDWRLYEQQGLPSYLHRHDQSKWVQQCELQFLKKMMEENSFTPANVEQEENRARSAASHRHHHKHNHHHQHHNHHGMHQGACGPDRCVPNGTETNGMIDPSMYINHAGPVSNQPSVGQVPNNPDKPVCCELCGKPYCDQPNHAACKQQHAQCEQQRERMQREQEGRQQRSRSAAAHRSSRPSRCRSAERSQTADDQQLRDRLQTPPQFILNTGSGSSFECVGGVRKAGFLSVKKWLLRRRQHVELARKRGWKCYWACLKGTTLIFYNIGYDADENANKPLICCDNCVHSGRCPVAIRLHHTGFNHERIYENVGQAGMLCPCECHQNNCNVKGQIGPITQPKHLILVDGCIVQPIPEHPKREHVFCLSSAVGDAYLFQCPCDNELLNWVDAIQSACGAAIAKSRGRAGAVARLTSEIGCMQGRLERAARRKLTLEQQLETLLEQVHAIGGIEVLANAVAAGNGSSLLRSNPINPNHNDCNRLLAALRDLQSQLSTLELQLEREHCEQFRLRCYVSSMQRAGSNRIAGQPLELPNPKMLLAHVSKQTKHVLNRLGIFNVSSLHAYTCARSPQLLNSLLLNLSQQMQHNKAEDTYAEDRTLFRVAEPNELNDNQTMMMNSATVTNRLPVRRGSQVRLQVIVPPPGPTVHDLLVDGGRTVEQLIEQLLGERRAQLAAQWRRLMRAQHLPSSEFFVCCKLVARSGYFVPDSKLRIDRLPPIQHMRLLRKRTLRLQLHRSSNEAMFGFSVEAHCTSLNDENEQAPGISKIGIMTGNENKRTETNESNVLRTNGRLQVLVCKVEANSEAARKGLRKGDELIQLNGASVAELDMMFVECVLQEELSLNLVLRCARFDQETTEETENKDQNDLFAGLDMYETFDAIQSIDRPGSALRPNGRSYSGGNEQQVRNKPLRRHSEHVLGSNSNEDQLEDCLDAPNSDNQMFEQSLADDYIDSLVCPPPPQDAALSDELIDKLIIPKPDQLDRNEIPDENVDHSNDNKTNRSRLESVGDLTENLIKSVQQVKAQLAPNTGKSLSKVNTRNGRMNKPQTLQLITTVVEVQVHDEPKKETPNVTTSIRSQEKNKVQNAEILHRRRKSEELPRRDYNNINAVSSPSEGSGNELQIEKNSDKKHSLTDSEKTHRVISELVDTEITYVNHLQRFNQMYLKPIRQQNILSSIDSLSLFGPTDDVLQFQCEFLKLLQMVVDRYLPSDQNLHSRSPDEYQNVLIQLSKLFLYHTPQFRLYSVFCSAHSKAQKLLFNKDSPNTELQDFVKRTSNGEKSNSLETFLIKPIQRILKYPLLLQQLRDLCPVSSIEHDHLSASLKAMEKVAEHINEMQRINEEYGHVLDSLQRTHFKSTRQLISVGPTQLLYYDQIYWRNASDYLGKLKKNVDLYSMCFVFTSAVIFFCMERNKQKKKSNMRDCLDTVRYQILMPINEVQVRATRQDTPTSINIASTSIITSPEELNNQYQWELIHLKCSLTSVNTQKRTEKVFQLGNSSSTFRNVFLRTIRRLIRESVRNLSLPSKNVINDNSSNQIQPEVEQTPGSKLATNVATSIEEFEKMSLEKLMEKQLQLRYFNASTLMRHLEETNGFEEEDKSCASEK